MDQERDKKMDELDELYDELYDDEERPLETEEEDPKKDRVIQNKLLFLVLCFVVFLIPVLWYFGVGVPVDTDGVFVGEIHPTTAGTLEIPLMLEGSALSFTITTQAVEGDTLIIKPRFALVGFHRSGTTVIETKVTADEVDYIYLQGDNERDRVLIWENKEK